MANNSWQKEYSQLTMDERNEKVVEILSELVIRYIKNKPKKPKK